MDIGLSQVTTAGRLLGRRASASRAVRARTRTQTGLGVFAGARAAAGLSRRFFERTVMVIRPVCYLMGIFVRRLRSYLLTAARGSCRDSTVSISRGGFCGRGSTVFLLLISGATGIVGPAYGLIGLGAGHLSASRLAMIGLVRRACSDGFVGAVTAPIRSRYLAHPSRPPPCPLGFLHDGAEHVHPTSTTVYTRASCGPYWENGLVWPPLTGSMRG